MYRVSKELADVVAVMLALGQLHDGNIVHRIGNTLSVIGESQEQHSPFSIPDSYLAMYMGSIPDMPHEENLIFRITDLWPGLSFLLYHPRVLLSPLDLDAKAHDFDAAYLDSLVAQVHGTPQEVTP